MSRDKRIAVATLIAAMGLHICILAMVAWLWQETPLTMHKVTTRYVVRTQQPLSAPSPSAVPPVSKPVQPVPPQQATTVVAPLEPQSFQPQQQRQPATLPPEAPVRPANPNAIALPKPVRPRKPSKPQHPRLVSRTRPSPQTASLPGPPPSVKPQPKQPKAASQQALTPPPQQASPSSQDVIQAYLAQVFAALERHKYYPAMARRRRLSGRVVMQFVILPDGRVLDPQITELNGASPFSAAALTALRRASPLPAFPPKLEQPRLLVEVPMVYNMKGGR